MHYWWRLFTLTVWTAFLHLVLASHCDKSSSSGNEFVIGFIGGYGKIYANSVYLLITSTTNTTTNVQIIVPFLNFDEKRSFNNTVNIAFNATILQYGGTSKQFKAIEVYSDSNISLSAMVMYGDTTEGFLVLPTSALGTRYVAASYVPYASYNNEILVIGTERNTDIHINYTLDGKIVSNSTQIQPYETYQLSIHHDLSGAVITSNKPIAVISGSAASKIPVNAGDYQYLVEQLVPTKYWGHKYIVPPIYPHRFFFLKLFADEDGTEVHYYNATRHATEYIHRGSVLEMIFGSSPVVIVSNKPINVVQYNLDNENLYGDPFMTTAQSMSQFMDSYKFISPGFAYAFTTVVITINKTKVAGLRLNGNPLTTLNPITVAVPDPLSSYVTIYANITYGTLYDVHHVDKDVYFGASLYGVYTSTVAYGYPLGFTLDCNTDQTNTSTTATTTTSQPLTVGNTTNVHHGNPWTQQPFGGNGTWCFKCEDMYSLANCDVVTRCSSNSQRCYVQRYKRNQSTYVYRSGCMEQDTCMTENHNAECHECCDGQFCNTHGCGDAGLDNFQERGPFCFDCAYQSDRQLCNTVQMCRTNQVCSIVTHNWGNGISHTQECVDKLVCDSRTGRSVHELQLRSAPLCSHCCSTDFCNVNCTSINIPSIIG